VPVIVIRIEIRRIVINNGDILRPAFALVKRFVWVTNDIPRSNEPTLSFQARIPSACFSSNTNIEPAGFHLMTWCTGRYWRALSRDREGFAGDAGTIEA
jgi:hypothetical protein